MLNLYILESLPLWVSSELRVHFKNLESIALESSLDSIAFDFSMDCQDLSNDKASS